MIVVNNERRNLRLAVDVFVVVDVFFFLVCLFLRSVSSSLIGALMISFQIKLDSLEVNSDKIWKTRGL